MGVFVGFLLCHLTKTHIAVPALVRFVTGVGALVNFLATNLDESFVAVLALVRFLSGVRHLMGAFDTSFGEGPVTVLTLVELCLLPHGALLLIFPVVLLLNKKCQNRDKMDKNISISQFVTTICNMV